MKLSNKMLETLKEIVCRSNRGMNTETSGEGRRTMKALETRGLIEVVSADVRTDSRYNENYLWCSTIYSATDAGRSAVEGV